MRRQTVQITTVCAESAWHVPWLHRLGFTYFAIQWNLSITDTLGPEKQFAIQRFSQFRGCFTYRAIYLAPPKQFVIERFLLLGEFVIL